MPNGDSYKLIQKNQSNFNQNFTSVFHETWQLFAKPYVWVIGHYLSKQF